MGPGAPRSSGVAETTVDRNGAPVTSDATRMCELLVGLGDVRVLAVNEHADGLVDGVETTAERDSVPCVWAAGGGQGPADGGVR